MGFLNILGGFTPLVELGASLWNSDQDRKVAKRNTDATIKAQKELAQYEFDRNYEMWKENNAYNTPAAQMERLSAAGLNPNLVYGSGAVVGNTSGSIPQYNAPKVEYNYKGRKISVPQLAQLGQYLQGIRLNNAELQNKQDYNNVLNAQADKIAAEAAKVRADTIGSTLQNQNLQFDYGLKTELRETQKSMALEGLRKLKQDLDLGKIKLDMSKLDLEDRRTGVRPQDPWYIRDAVKLLQSGMESSAVGKGVVNLFRRLLGIDFTNLNLNRNGL